MDPALRSQLGKVLQERCQAVAECWYQAIARTSYVSLAAAGVRQRLADWAEQAVVLLVTEPFEQTQAQEIGAALARLHYLQPEALGRTLGVLAARFVEGLPADQAAMLQPNLAVLLEGVATGFVRQADETVLAEQEAVRGALVSGLQVTTKSLREARDELDRRVQDRTIELARANEELRIEIAERKRAEAALQESEKTARVLLNAPSDLAALVDANGFFLDANEAMARQFGKQASELIGTYGLDLKPQDVVERRKAYFEGVLRSGKPVHFEDERQGVWFDNCVYPVCDADGKVTRVALMARDITDRKRMEKALKESEERWRTLVENAPDIVLTVDREGRILFVNRAGPDADLAANRNLGRSIVDFALPEARELTRKSIEKVFLEGSNEYFEAPTVLSDGATTWYANQLGPIRRNGEVVAAMVLSRNITDRKQIEEMRNNLIRDVSHELRTPLAKVQMGLELLLEVLNKEPINRQKATEIGGMVFGNAQRLLETVEAILDLSALDAGRVVYERVQILPEELIDKALQYMQPMAEAKGLELAARVPDSLPAIEGDSGQLFRVLVNLIANAIKFTDQGQIVISGRKNEREVEFAVSDLGYGIHKENLGRIFDRFYQERPKVPGAGVGLPICQAIVKAHGGRIWGESPGRGRGSTLRFTLPVLADKKE